MKTQLISVIFLVFAAFTVNTFACLQTETGVPACAYWTRADAVFSGKVLKVENAAKSEDLPADSRKVRFQVLQNFKGADNPTFSLITTGAKTDCGLEIKAGQTWIIYANNDIVLKSFSVFRGVKIEPKLESAELETLKLVVAGTTSAAISGRIVWQPRNDVDLYEIAEEITVEGNGRRFSAQPGANGVFNIPVPSAGTYKVELKFLYDAPLKWADNLLNTSYTQGNPTFFRYEVRLNDGDCNYSLFEVLKR